MLRIKNDLSTDFGGIGRDNNLRDRSTSRDVRLSERWFEPICVSCRALWYSGGAY